MIRRFIIPCLAAIFILLAAAPPASAQAEDWKQIKVPNLPEFHPQIPKRVVLPNGLVLLLQEDHELPLVNGMLRIRGGSLLEPAEKTGLVDIYGDVWRTGGTSKRTGDELDDFLEARAAKIETNGLADSTTVNFSCLKQDLPDVFRIFVELVQDPAFRDDKIVLAKNQMDTAIARRNDNSGQIARRISTQLAYGKDNPYAREAEYATVAAVTRDDLVQWHKKYVFPNNMILGIVGDFDSNAMEAMLRKALGSWQKGPEAPQPKIDFQPAKPGAYFVAKEDVNQSEIRMVEMGIERRNPDYFAAEVLNYAFGGGFSSRLFRVLRTERGLAYGVGGGIGTAFDHPGILRLAMGTKSATTASAIEGLNEQVADLLKNPPNEEELRHAKDEILNAFVFNFDSKEKVLHEQMTYEFYGYPLDFLDRYRSGVEKVSTEDVARVARKYFHPGQFAILVVGNPGELGNQLASLGPVTNVDITIPPRPGIKTAASAPKGSNPAGQELIAKVAQALGGESKLQGVKAVRQKFTMLRKTPTGEIPVQIENVTVFPDQEWAKMQTPMGEMVVVSSPNAAFLSAGGQVRDMPSSQKQDMVEGTKRELISIVQHANDPKYQFSAAGKEKIGTREAAILDINAGGTPVRWWVDPASGRVLRIAYQRNGPQGPAEQQVDLSNWKTVDGLTLPFRRTMLENGQPAGSADIQEIQINPPVDPKMFEKPATEAAK